MRGGAGWSGGWVNEVWRGEDVCDGEGGVYLESLCVSVAVRVWFLRGVFLPPPDHALRTVTLWCRSQKIVLLFRILVIFCAWTGAGAGACVCREGKGR